MIKQNNRINIGYIYIYLWGKTSEIFHNDTKTIKTCVLLASLVSLFKYDKTFDSCIG